MMRGTFWESSVNVDTSGSVGRPGGDAISLPTPITLYEKKDKVMHNSGPVILFSMIHHPGRECIRIPGT
jgi:hypothetical protein